MQFKTKTYYPLLFLYLLFTVSSRIEAQNETNNWFFGGNSGIHFNEDIVSSISGNMDTPAGCSSISDDNGDLLFYTNGNTIWNKNHQIMDNGEGLYGEVDNVQTSIIIPKPDDPTTYYVFVTKETNSYVPIIINSGVFYSEIKITPQNPLGIVTVKNERITVNATARLAAIYHYESNSYRLICLTKSNQLDFKIFTITNQGLQFTPVILNLTENIGSFGAMKISPNGKFLAVADNLDRYIYIYEFDVTTLTCTPYLTLSTFPKFGLGVSPYGIEFSQDSNNFYYAGDNYVVQYQFTARDSMEIVDAYIMNCPKARSLQLGRNGKIYVASENNPFLSVIHEPEKYGEACNFESNAVSVSPTVSKKGLPIFVSSFLRNRIVIPDDCISKSFHFKLDAYGPITSVNWDFGDNSTSTELEPIHNYSQPGIYQVKAVVVLNNKTIPLFKELEVFPLPSLPENTILTQCNDDAFSFFNLENIKDYLSFSNSNFVFQFYNTEDDANNDLNPIPNHQNYINTSNPQEIFAKIISDKGCSIITNFFIENRQSQSPNVESIYTCEDSDNVIGDLFGRFNLVSKKEDLINELGIPSTYRINFYRSQLDALTKLNVLDRYPVLPSMTIWVRIEDESFNCYGIISFQAVVNDPIEFDLETFYTICENTDTPLIIDGGGNNSTWEWKKTTGEILSTSRFFELNQIGNYILSVSRFENGLVCNQDKRFTVLKAVIPQYQSINAENGQLSVVMQGQENYMYSLNGVDYYGNGNTYTFTNLEPSVYYLFVKDKNGCENRILSDIILLNYPPFFTPNNDGVNDKWRIDGPLALQYSSANVTIYDRYGKLIYTFDSMSSQAGWDGLYNNLPLPASDYWYQLILTSFNGETSQKRGHFSLKR